MFAAPLPKVKGKQRAGDRFPTGRIQSITTAKIFKALFNFFLRKKKNACLLFRGITSLTF